jgi:hypothetical protein
VDELPPEMQEQVLRFLDSLARPLPTKQQGSTLRAFAGSLDAGSAREMARAIEEECGRVDASQW